MAHQTLQQCFNVVPGKITCLQTRKEIITGEVFIVQSHGQSSCWISASVQLYSSTRLDPSKFISSQFLVCRYSSMERVVNTTVPKSLNIKSSSEWSQTLEFQVLF